MAKFKKNFWSGSMKMEDGRVVDTPEPSWYNQAPDPTSQSKPMGFHRSEYVPSGLDKRLSEVKVGDRVVQLSEAYTIYKLHSKDDKKSLLKKTLFRLALINGTTFKTMKGTISGTGVAINA